MTRTLISLVVIRTSLFGAAVSPAGYELAEGNSGSSTPFNQTGVRFQQVYGASDFDFVTPGWIRGLNFRVDGSPGGGGMSFLNTTLTNVQISLSTTLAQPDSLSPIFQDNIGLNNTVVRAGALTIHGTDSHLPGQGNPFDVGVALTTPFFYDPAEGNLLLDVRNFLGAATSPFDAVNISGDSVSSLYSLGADAVSGTPSSLGLVTYFTIDAVPEPSTWALVITGLTALGLSKRARGKLKG